MTNDAEELVRTRPEDNEADLYDENGNVRGDFLALVGAAIADRDTIFLRQHVARLHDRSWAICWNRSSLINAWRSSSCSATSST